jgi:hypothetical protein
LNIAIVHGVRTALVKSFASRGTFGATISLSFSLHLPLLLLEDLFERVATILSPKDGRVECKGIKLQL